MFQHDSLVEISGNNSGETSYVPLRFKNTAVYKVVQGDTMKASLLSYVCLNIFY